MRILLRFEPDIPAGQIGLNPVVPERMLALRIENLPVADSRLTPNVGVDVWHIEGLLPNGLTQCPDAAIPKSKTSF
jgi:hypothetical protein